MEEIASLRKARDYVKAKLTRLRTQVLEVTEKTGVKFDKEQAETRLERLEGIYREFEAIQRQLLDKVGDFTVDDTTEDEFFEQRYFEQSEMMQQFGRGFQSDTATPSSLSSSGNEALAAILSRQTEILDRVAITAESVNTDARVKLPTIKLPRFDGKIEEWKYFADSFRSIIHNKPHLSNIEKFQYLISSISGDAAKIIESIELTEQNYTTAWELLQQRYDDPRSLKKKHIQCLFMMPIVAKESAKALRDLIDHTSRHLRVLKVLGLPIDSWDELIMHMMETRFDVKTLRAWEEEVESKDEAKLDDMIEFLKRKCQTLERIESRVSDRNEKSLKESDQRTKGAIGSKSHLSTKNSASQKAVLTASINSGMIKTCKMGNCRECAGRHNTLCHLPQDNKIVAKSDVAESQGITDSEPIKSVAVHASSNLRGRQVIMATATVEATRRNGSSTSIRVLLDSANEANFITQAAHNKLGLKRNRISEIVTGLNGTASKIENVCEVHVKSRHSNFEINTQCLIVPKITKTLPSMEINRSKLQIPKPDKLDLEQGQLVLQNTKLGWIVAGTMPSSVQKSPICNQFTTSLVTCSENSCEMLREELEKFWKLENCDDYKARTLSITEKKCGRYFEQTTTRDSDGRFIVRLPFQDVKPPIGNNREIARKRLHRLEHTLKGNEAMYNQYINIMREYINLGHMSEVSNFDNPAESIVYLPHHGVVKEASSSTKLRVVFDASVKNNKDVSLNDALLVVPVLHDNLTEIVVRFRFFKIALTADLQKMYRQISVHIDDRIYQHILWRFSTEEPIKEYCLNTVIFGAACSPFLAVSCVRRLAKKGAKRHPLASSALLENTYVDDIISGANTILEARVLQNQLSELLQGGFEAHKWCSNSQDALREVPTKLRESNPTTNIDANNTISTLGLEWNLMLDVFQFKTQMVADVSTKREMLSAISKLFDPLGLIGPVLTVAKILMQGLWEIKIDWDDPLPETILFKWRMFQESLEEVHTLRVPRVVISLSENSRFSILGFCDASKNAYGACVYIQSLNEANGETTVKLLCSKARVAPLKKVSIPKLELCSALLLARLINNVKRAIQIKIDGVHAWTDSMVVLYWIISRWKPFVSNRVSEIVESVPAIYWQHVKGSENPADLISRGATLGQLKGCQLWWNGPRWLVDTPQSARNENIDWKFSEEDLDSAAEETRKEFLVCNLNIQQPLKRTDRICTKLTLAELQAAQREIIKYSQSVYFHDDVKNLKNKRQLSPTSRLLQLNAFLDEDGIIRVGGRLHEAPWNWERKHPIVLPAKYRGIEWSFIPPYSPHLGGLWEAGVKSCKYHLKRAMGNTLFTFEELTTLLVQIEACLNSRPLSPLSSDPSDLQPLTPGHFIVGGPLTGLPETDLSELKINRLNRWEMIQRAVQDFWKRWADEYVANLQSRVKWKTEQKNLKINDLVLLREDNLPPLK
ncbi:hypothetical protein DMN91_000026 [Ooceraea biroi]|uniref:DUF5641 domain-containing protein n=3 Tax=Ooceraea biroi TaxID=2015173 RepID=A0A3L8E195_OOCBI|nr:hypothetical protein DMN91_000026 [Ooceraea biroi]